MARKSKTSFFEDTAENVARTIIGRTIWRYIAGEPVKAKVVVAGAYEGLTGNRKEQEGMLSPPGQIYMMSVRGVYSLNFGTESAETPSVVCIIGLQVETPSGLELLVGPGKVAERLRLDGKFDGISLDELPDLSIKGRSAPRDRVLSVLDGARIGTGKGSNRVNYSDNCVGIYALKELVG